jgi:glycosyltransferase involved in cell wall biosynthesis
LVNLDEVTPLILTYDEAPNIERTLAPLAWAKEILVIDSGSSDGTLDLLARHANVRVVHRAFDDHTSQWNFGLDLVNTPWVLSLDADYVLGEDFICELQALAPCNELVAYFAGFRYVVFRRPLRATLYPERAVLFRRKSCRYAADGHTQTLRPCGQTGRLAARIDHDDRKPLRRWLSSQRAYAVLEAEELLSKARGRTSAVDWLRRQILFAAPAALLYTLVFRRCLLDGWRGWYYAMQRAYAELLLSLELLDRKLQREDAFEGSEYRGPSSST